MNKFDYLERFEDERRSAPYLTIFMFKDLELQVDSFAYEYGETQAIIQFDTEVVIEDYGLKSQRIDSIDFKNPTVFLIDQDGGEFGERKLDTDTYDKHLKSLVLQELKAKRII